MPIKRRYKLYMASLFWHTMNQNIDNSFNQMIWRFEGVSSKYLKLDKGNKFIVFIYCIIYIYIYQIHFLYFLFLIKLMKSYIYVPKIDRSFVSVQRCWQGRHLLPILIGHQHCTIMDLSGRGNLMFIGCKTLKLEHLWPIDKRESSFFFFLVNCKKCF